VNKVSSAARAEIPSELGKPQLLALYRQMFLIRRFERTAQAMLKAGELPGFLHLYVGEEATATGVMAHLRPDDWITSTHRGHGHALAKGVSAKEVMAELGGRATGCCGGRGGTMHLYAPSVGLLGTNGIVASGIPAATGCGISAKVRGTDQVAVAFFGDGATNHGAFYEGINLAGIQNAPVIFVCENNLYATATPLTMATRNTNIASKAQTFGIPGVRVDGNDVLAVWRVTKEAVDRARSGGGPTLIESQTYRMVGHHEGDPLVGTYRTQAEMDEWAKRCPIDRFGRVLIETGCATLQELRDVEADVEREIQEAADFTRQSPWPDPATARLHTWADPINPPVATATNGQPQKTVVQGWLDAVRDGIAEEMRQNPHIIYFGEGIGERGGTYGHTKNLFQEFGGQRVIDTPICELGFTGASVGASATGCRAVADLMLSDFLWEAGGQIVLQGAKLRYMSNGEVSVPMIVRSGMGVVKNAGPHHSACYYPVWAHAPGLIVVVPSNPADAKGLMKTALRASDPVIFYDTKALMGMKGPVPVGEHYVPFGQANIVREGTDLTMVSCGQLLHRSVEAAELLAGEGISCEVIDLRTIVPLDIDTIIASVAKTGRLLVVDEAYAMCGVGAEIAAEVMERAFDELDAPVGRLHIDPVAHPFSPTLENAVVPDAAKVVTAARAVLEGKPLVPLAATGGVAPAPRLQPKPVEPAPSAPAPAAKTPAPAVETPAPAPAAAPKAAAAGTVPVVVPNMDLTITEVTIVKWLKRVGERVKSGEALAEVETDKAVSEIESPADGELVEILVKAGENAVLLQQIASVKP
jgi:2-oxoisovalerate dehydrogenase E1 component